VESCGIVVNAVRVELDPATPLEMGDAVAAVAESGDGWLLLYYVGHGLVSPPGRAI
jgi:hypothetical protein